MRDAVECPARRLERYAAFCRQDEGLNPYKAHFLCDPSCERVKKTACVLGAVCAKPRNFRYPVLLSLARYRTTHHNDAHQLAAMLTANAEPMPDSRLMMTMKLANKTIGLQQSCRDRLHSTSHLHRGHPY